MIKQGYTSTYQLGVTLNETERQQLEYIVEKLKMRRSDFIRLTIGYFYDQLQQKEEAE